MQRDKSKLKTAHFLRLVGRLNLIIAGAFLINFLFYMVSGGYREPFSLGYYSLAGAGVFALFFWLLTSRAYKLEFPFLSSRGR